MKTTLAREGSTTIRLSVEATAEEIAPATDVAFRKLAREVNVPGFRKGKAPRQVLAARLGKEAVREAALQEAIPMLYAQAVVEEHLEPVAPPKIEVTSADGDEGVSFEALLEVRPEIRLPDYAGVVVSKPSSAATGEEIDEQLKRMQDRFATLETVSRPATGGSYVLMNLTSTIHGEAIEAATGTDLLIEVGSGAFVPQLDEKLEGAKAGDVLKFNAVLPEGIGEHGGREVSCQVLVKEVRAKILPTIDDEFAKTASEYDTLDELREDLRKRLAQIKAATADAEVRSRVLETLVDTTDFDVPESLVEEEFAFRLQRFSDRLRTSGIGVDDYLSGTEQSEDQVEGDLRKQAERNIRAQLLLDEIGKAEKLEAGEDELNDEIRRHAEALRGDPEEIRERLVSRGRLGALRGDIIRRKALDLIVDRADIRYEDSREIETAGARDEAEGPADKEQR